MVIDGSTPPVLTRRRFLASLGALGAAAVAGDAVLVEPERVDVTRHVLGVRPPVGGVALSIVQLSDLHLGRIGDHERRIAAAVHALAPDLVLFTGDSIDRRRHLPELASFLALLDPDTPKYAILGNWEYASGVSMTRLASVYAARNCRLLVNESVLHRAGRRELLITGLDDLLGGSPSMGRALGGAEPCGNHLLLAHCPAYRDAIAGAAAERTTAGPAGFTPQYMLAGHTHGGQVTFFGWAPVLPAGSGHYLSGWYRDVSPHLYVSRGLGTTAVPVRLGAVPEVAQFTWWLAAGA